MSWNREADVVIVGAGGAGMSAAIAAHDLGAKVLILEKNREVGGSTKLSGGNIRTYPDGKNEEAAKHYELLSGGTTEIEVYRTLVSETPTAIEWLKHLGGSLEDTPNASIGFPYFNTGVSAFPFVPFSEGLGKRVYVKGSNTVHGAGSTRGENLSNLLERNVLSRSIEILVNTAAERLIINDTHDVIGVLAEQASAHATSESKDTLRIRAHRGVVLACGGYENNERIQANYLPFTALGAGIETNTGDGIRMAQALGADLWHMNAWVLFWGLKVPVCPIPVKFTILSNRFVLVDRNGKRFINEQSVEHHSITYLLPKFDYSTASYPLVPTIVVFDSETAKSGPIGWPKHGRSRDFLEWSEDNSQEIEKGWIKKGDSFEELAAEVGLDPVALAGTMRKYNESCKVGSDEIFGRPSESLEAIDQCPFYAAELWPGIVNTQGGPRRNNKAQIVNPFGEPIKRLYSAGELGSVFAPLYPGAGNITECLVFGRIAGTNAAGETPI